MTLSEIEALHAQCELRHTEIDRRLAALEDGQRVRDERLYGRVNKIAEDQAALKSTVAAVGETLTAVAGDVKTLSSAGSTRTGQWLLSAVGWIVAGLIAVGTFVLKEVLTK